MSYTSLISVDDLSRYLASPDWRIIDCRFNLMNTTQGRQDYLQSHIPGAVYAHLDEDLSGAVVPGVSGRHPLPAIDAFVAMLSRWGIDERVQVVVYDDNGGIFAARLWWMLRWLGHDKVAVLDGGWRHWLADDQSVDNDEPTIAATQFTPQRRDHLLADASDILADLAGDRHCLLDARGADRFRGENETLDPVAGHIPGAISAPFIGNLATDGRFLDQQALRARYRALLNGVQAAQTTVYCGSGVTAAHTILAMLHAGLGDARLYVGSWSHWITDPARPVAVGE